MMNKISSTSTSRESDKFMLRLPDGMRQLIAVQAKANGRSMNAEMIYRLQCSFEEDAESGNKHQSIHNVAFTAPNIPTNWSPDFVEELREVLAFIRNGRDFTVPTSDTKADEME